MEFPFDISKILRKPISIISAADLRTAPKSLENFYYVIDELGIASAKAQGLRVPVTSGVKLKQNPEQRLYVMREAPFINPDDVSVRELEQAAGIVSHPLKDNSTMITGHADKSSHVVVGMIKVGPKKLFLVDEYGRNIEINMLCILDFYVSESLQRQGFGRRLFEFMLSIENVPPHILAYDKPSSKCLAFLERHFNLFEYVPQPNNFIVFKEFGLGMLALDSKGRPRSPIPCDPKAFKKPVRRVNSPSRAEGLSKMFSHFTRAAELLKQEKVPETVVPPHLEETLPSQDPWKEVAEAESVPERSRKSILSDASNPKEESNEQQDQIQTTSSSDPELKTRSDPPMSLSHQPVSSQSETSTLPPPIPNTHHHSYHKYESHSLMHSQHMHKSPFHEKYGKFSLPQAQPYQSLTKSNAPLGAAFRAPTLVTQSPSTNIPTNVSTEAREEKSDTAQSDAIAQLWPSSGTMAATRVAVISGSKTIQMLELAEQERKARIRLLMGNNSNNQNGTGGLGLSDKPHTPTPTNALFGPTNTNSTEKERFKLNSGLNRGSSGIAMDFDGNLSLRGENNTNTKQKLYDSKNINN